MTTPDPDIVERHATNREPALSRRKPRPARPEVDRPWSRDDVLSTNETAGRLPMRREDAADWLREMSLLRVLKGREVVIWGEVLDALRNPTPPKPARAVGSLLPRADLTPRRGPKKPRRARRRPT